MTAAPKIAVRTGTFVPFGGAEYEVAPYATEVSGPPSYLPATSLMAAAIVSS